MRVLFCISGIGRGHAARCRPLLIALQRRGHECVAAVPGGRAAAVLEDRCAILRPPADFRARVAPPPIERPAFLAVHDLEACLSAYQRDLRDGLEASVAYIDAAIRSARPDVVVVDQIMGAGALARAHGLPAVQVSHPPMLPGHGPWATWAPRRDPRTQTPSALPVLNALFDRLGLAAPPSVESLLEGDLLVVPSHPGFGSAPGALHVRPEDEVGATAMPSAPAHGERAPRVLVYLGGGAERLADDVVRAVLDAGARALVVDGMRLEVQPSLAGDSRVQLTGPVPMDRVLSDCAAIVHHGGSGTAHAALSAGVAAVAVPTNTEQELNARKVEELGAGRFVPVSEAPLQPFEVRPGFTTLAHRSVEGLEERLADALRSVLLDPSSSSRAAELGAELAALPPVADAALALEGLARERAA